MINKRLIGRLLDIFYNKKSEFNEVMQNYDGFSYLENIEPELGFSNLKPQNW